MKRAILFLLLAGSCFGQTADIWKHIYHPQRLHLIEANATVTGTIVDATHGKRKQGCRSEADGDLHCWLKLDPGLERYINAENVKNQGGNLVFEPICQHRVTQADAQAACKNYKQPLIIPPVGSRVAITGDSVLDTQHGHKEFHPVSRILVLGYPPLAAAEAWALGQHAAEVKGK